MSENLLKPLLKRRFFVSGFAGLLGLLLAVVFVQQRQLNQFRTAQQTGEEQRKERPERMKASVPFIRVLANPEYYDGKRIRVVGYLNIEFEGNFLFFHEEDHKHLLFDNAVGVDIPEDIERNPKSYKRRYVLVDGTFEAGDGLLQRGNITKVTLLQPWNR